MDDAFIPRWLMAVGIHHAPCKIGKQKVMVHESPSDDGCPSSC
jgi:hypothetical protein